MLDANGGDWKSIHATEEVHRYEVNGRIPLEWYIDRYKIKTDKESSILNDPNG